VDALFRDGYRALDALRGRRLSPEVAQAFALLATVIGQDIQETADGRFIIAQGVAPDRVISVVDPQAGHGHKSNARGFDGYKAHVAIDPDSEIICAAEVGAANTGDVAMAPALLADLQQRGITTMTKVAAPTAPHGHFTKQQFRIDLDLGTVTCPARLTVPIVPARQGGGVARFGRACQVCPLQASCTSSQAGRTVTIHPHETRLQAARARQREPAWRADYRAHRPHRGAQAGPPAAPPPRRPKSPGSRPDAGRAGLAAAGRCGQPRPLRRARRAFQTGRLGRRVRVAPSEETLHDPARQRRWGTISVRTTRRPRSAASQTPIGHQRPRVPAWRDGTQLSAADGVPGYRAAPAGRYRG
jgi:hypothetical protein